MAYFSVFGNTMVRIQILRWFVVLSSESTGTGMIWVVRIYTDLIGHESYHVVIFAVLCCWKTWRSWRVGREWRLIRRFLYCILLGGNWKATGGSNQIASLARANKTDHHHQPTDPPPHLGTATSSTSASTWMSWQWVHDASRVLEWRLWLVRSHLCGYMFALVLASCWTFLFLIFSSVGCKIAW